MKDQHTMITGYRDLTQDEIDLMNRIKEHGETARELLEAVRSKDIDQRWASIAQTHFQEGYMALVRSVAKPTTF